MGNDQPVADEQAASLSDTHHESALRKACIRTAVSFCFAFLVSLALIALSDTGQVKLLRSKGSDAGMRIIANPYLSPFSDLGRSNNPFYFIDVDDEACNKFYRNGDSAGKCKPGAPPPPDLLVALLKAIDETVHPAIIIVDFELPSRSDLSPGEAGALIARLTQPDGAPIIAPAPLRPSNSVGVTSWYSSGELIDGLSEGRLRLAAFTAWTDNRVGDGVVRGYLPIVQVSGMRPGDLSRRYVPSAPFLAALVVSENGQLHGVDQTFYPSSDSNGCQFAERHTGTILDVWLEGLPSGCPRSTLGLTADQLGKVAKLDIPYTILSIAQPAPPPGRTIEGAYAGGGSIKNGMLYQHRYASGDALSEPPFKNLAAEIQIQSTTGPNTPAGAGMIVLIGSSSVNSGDWHTTPLGRMAGTEVVMNATRAFNEFQPLETDMHPVTALLLEILFAFVAAAAVFLSIFVAIKLECWLKRRLCEKGGTESPKVSAAPRGLTVGRVGSGAFFWLLRTVIYLIGTAAAIFAVSEVNYLLLWKFGFQVRVDFLIPVLAVVFAGLVEIAKEVIEGLEMAIEWILHVTTKLFGT